MATPNSMLPRRVGTTLLLLLLLLSPTLAQTPRESQVEMTRPEAETRPEGEARPEDETGDAGPGEAEAGAQPEDEVEAGAQPGDEAMEAEPGGEVQPGDEAGAPVREDGEQPENEAEGQAGTETEEQAGQESADEGQPAAKEDPPTGREGGDRSRTVATTVVSDGDDVLGMSGERVLWRFEFPDDSGGTGAVLHQGDTVWVGHGNSVLQLDPATGVARSRHAMPGRVLRIEPTDGSVSVVSDVDGRLRQRIEIGPDGPTSTVRFGISPQLFGWLRSEADVPDPARRLESDPTNPWLHLRAGLGGNAGRLEEAVERGETFYDLAGMARVLYGAGETQLAGEAMEQALADFARRGYDPRLLTDPELHRAYDFPLAPMEEALFEGDMDAAEFWAPWLYLVSSDEAPATREALAEYARRLQEQGRRDAANLWRERADQRSSSSPAASLDRFFLGLGRSGWYGVAAILAAILALHLTLLAKYWAPQTLALKRRRETGGGRRPWARLFAIRYYSFTEKLVLVLLFAACLALLGLTRWYEEGGARTAVLSSGTLSSPTARDAVTTRPLEGPRGAYIRGYAAHVAGEEGAARQEYLAAGDYPPALNNLAALLGDDVLYRRALELAPGMPEASYNLGRSPDPLAFHAAFQRDEPLLAAPGGGDFRTATSGSWQQAVQQTFMNPWLALERMPGLDIPALLWRVLLVLFLLWLLATIVWLVIPRPALARNAPRNWVYHLLALLIPGSGLADEAWGVLLMVPWALLGVDALAQWLDWGRSLGLALETELWALAAIYLINLIAFIVEFVSYRRRMRNLWRRSPEAVEAFGLRGA